MNRPSPSLGILAAVAVLLALIFFGRRYLEPTHPRDTAFGRAAVAGYVQPSSADITTEEDAATTAAMVDAGHLWARRHRPNSAAGCPIEPLAFHRGCADAVAANER